MYTAGVDPVVLDGDVGGAPLLAQLGAVGGGYVLIRGE